VGGPPTVPIELGAIASNLLRWDVGIWAGCEESRSEGKNPLYQGGKMVAKIWGTVHREKVSGLTGEYSVLLEGRRERRWGLDSLLGEDLAKLMAGHSPNGRNHRESGSIKPI